MLYTDVGNKHYLAEGVFKEASGSKVRGAKTASGLTTQRPLIQYFRKGSETAFSRLTTRFSRQIHAVTAAGFALRIALFIFPCLTLSWFVVRNLS